MKVKYYFKPLLVIILFVNIGFSQELDKNGTKYTLIGKLVKSYEKDCDCQSLIIKNKLFEFEVLELNMNEYILKKINIVVPCPEGYGEDFFKKGNIFKIEFYDNCTNMSMDESICENDISKRKRMRRRFWINTIAIQDKNNVPN